MRISRKYALFLLLTTIGSAGGVFFALSGVLRSSLEKEITKRGEAAAQNFAIANAPSILSSDTEQLQYELGALANDPDVVNARVADHTGQVIASLAQSDVGEILPAYFTAPDAPSTYADPATQAYHFRANIRYGTTPLGTFVLSLSSRPLERAVGRARNRAMLFSGTIAAVIVIFSLLLVQRELRPLREMSLTLQAIAKGDFSQRVPERRRDEIGQLATAFNYMLKRAELMFHYVDKLVVERLVSDEALSLPGGQLRNIAVVFGDMRGYTSMSNRRSPNEVVNIVNTYFHLFVECIALFTGIVDKTMGDAIMAVFDQHAGEPQRQHRRNGVLAVAYMKATSRILNTFLRAHPDITEQLQLEPREFGFAMASGPAIVGNIGSRRRMDYTVCGRVVNLASRLEGLTKSGEVIIDNFTYLATRDMFEVESLPPVQPKGFSADEKVVPHRLRDLVPEEAARMRRFLNILFSYSFVQEVLMPSGMPEREQHSWCRHAHREFERIVNETPTWTFYARANIDTGELLSDLPGAAAHTSDLFPVVAQDDDFSVVEEPEDTSDRKGA